MFGYICINQQELKVKDYEAYRGYYCGLCRNLQKRYGRIGQMLLNYDMTFLILLLTGLYEPKEQETAKRCIPHPVSSHRMIENEITDYAADMNILLSYQKAADDWRDEHSHPKRILASLLKKDYKRLRKQYSRQAKTLEKSIRLLSEAEKEGLDDIDYVSGLSGQFLGEIFAWKEDIWKEDLYRLGFFLGKFIYLMDAWEDMQQDEKKGCYNIFLLRRKTRPDENEEKIREMMVDMMSRCCEVFERLPILYRADLLRNILYSGVWIKYVGASRKREKKNEKSV